MAMASKDPESCAPLSMGEAKLHSLMEIALKCAGGQGYYVLSGKEDFYNSLSIKFVKYQQNPFFRLSNFYEERNELKNAEFQFGDDYTGSDSREEQRKGSAERSFNGSGGAVVNDIVGVNIGGNIGSNNSTSVRKKSRNKRVMNSKPIPPRSTLRRVTGHISYTFVVELSVSVNCEVIFSNLTRWNWFFSSSKTVTAHHVLSKFNGWDESTKTATIELQCLVETERKGIYNLDEEIDNEAETERRVTSDR